MNHPSTILLTAIAPSKTNPRKTFPKVELDELTDSIRRLGVLQPILLRPNGSDSSYELVAGERRYRAAKAAGLERIPATVRELTDAEVLEVQVVENLQRSDLEPMEEAEGYAALMKCAHPDGRVYTADEIASKIGKGKGYVYARLKLGELCKAGREALAEGKISVSVAELIARIPGEGQQTKAVEDVSDRWGAPMSLRDAREHIHRNFMLRLDQAPFDVKEIYFVHKPSVNTQLPPCAACPKRTGNNPDLFADVKAKDTCTDPGCFEAKTQADVAHKVQEHRAAGKTVIAGAEAKKILGKYEYDQPKGYVKLDARCDDDEKGRNWRAVLGKTCPEVVLVENVHKIGQFVEMVPAPAAREALLQKQPEIAKRKAQEQRERAKDERDGDVEREARWRLHLAVREQIGRDGFTNTDLRAIALDRLGDYDTEIDDRLMPYWGLEGETSGADLESAVKAAEGGALLQMLFDILAGGGFRNETFIAGVAKARGIDAKAIERQVKSDIKAKSKEQEPA